jgi:hypothetical protein
MKGALRSGLRVVAAAVAIVAVIAVASSFLPSLNLFGTRTVDRSQPVLLKSLERLSEYRAVSANLQVVVDVEKDAKFLPDFISGERTLLVAAGNVDAQVDFSHLKGDSIVINSDRTAATINVPRATLSEARLDLERTQVFDRKRGLFDRVGDAFGDGGADGERQLLALAQRKLASAAKDDPTILAAAERNTRSMLEGLLHGLGFTTVTIQFSNPAEPTTPSTSSASTTTTEPT